jgi:hypothetical protein
LHPSSTRVAAQRAGSLPVAHCMQGRTVGPMRLKRRMPAMFRVLSTLLLASPLARAAPPEAGSNCLALLGGRLDVRWGIPLAVLAGALLAWGLVVVVRRLLR